ncbi:hypothetical protein E1H99_10310 [Enterococcus hirae]|nr:hypothetical protein E1H99_10310 [Enterococcus hirae]
MLQAILNKPESNELFTELLMISEETWGYHEFQKEILKRKISCNQQKNMIKEAMQCGIETANKVRNEMLDTTIQEICIRLGTTISHQQSEETKERLTFATYDEETGIRLMTEPLEKLREQIQCNNHPLEKTENLILGHELFHHIESKDLNIYTQRTKIELWKLFGYRHLSTVRAVSEIAAMSFSKELNQVDFSVYIIEVLLLSFYDLEKSQLVLQRVKEIEKKLKNRYLL